MKTLHALIAAILLTGFAAASVDAAETGPAQAQALVHDAIRKEAAAQKVNRKWQTEKTALLNTRRNLRTEMKWLDLREAKLRRYVAALEERVAELEERRSRYERIRTELESVLVSTVDDLEAHIAGDLPFAAEERSDRIAFLRSTLDDYDLGIGEKLRRTLEALGTEADYGRTADVSRDIVVFEGREVEMTLVRAGRVGLYCLSSDGRTAGVFDPSSGEFRRLEDKRTEAVSLLSEMADKSRFVELPAIPLVPAGRTEILPAITDAAGPSQPEAPPLPQDNPKDPDPVTVTSPATQNSEGEKN